MVYNPDEVEKDCEEYNGGCWKCGTQFKLEEKETHCDNCRTLTRWWCNSCSKPFDIVDKDINKKLTECKVCGYFICPHCRNCRWDCNKLTWQKDILKILKKDIPIGKFPSLPHRCNEIVEYIELIKTSKERLTCPCGVPISYAKGDIKKLLAKMEGFKIKNIKDKKEFVERVDEVTELPIGTEITVNKIRKEGSYGKEYRDALNLLVCLGKFKIKWLKDKDKNDYCVFKREDNKKCSNLLEESLIINDCPKCKKRYDNKDKEYCDDCIFKKGKNKGERIKLKRRLNNCDTCQLYRGEFIKGNGKN